MRYKLLKNSMRLIMINLSLEHIQMPQQYLKYKMDIIFLMMDWQDKDNYCKELKISYKNKKKPL